MPKKMNVASKSSFIRTQPFNVAAKDVVTRAAEAGLKIAPTLVYQVRARLNKNGPKKGKRGRAVSGKATAIVAVAGQARKKPNASNFIRSLPLELTAKEVVERGAVNGFKFSTNLVYLVRQKSHQTGVKIGKAIGHNGHSLVHEKKNGHPIEIVKARGRRSGRLLSGTVRTTQKYTSGGTVNESSFRKLVLELGLSKARGILTDVERKIEALMSSRS